MKITYEKTTLLNVDELFRCIKKFRKEYLDAIEIKKKSLIKQLQLNDGKLDNQLLIKVDNEIAGYVHLMETATGDWTGKSMFQILNYIDTEYVLPKFRGKGVITEIRKQLERDRNVDTISLSINHILKKINYWQAEGYKYFVIHRNKKVQNYTTGKGIVFVTKKNDLMLNEYAKKLTLDDLTSFVTFHSNKQLNKFKNNLIESEKIIKANPHKDAVEWLAKENEWYKSDKNNRNTILTKIKQKKREAA